MTERIRVGVIGTGFAAGAHIDALRRVPAVEVVAVAASSEEKAKAAAERLSLDQAFGDYRDLLAGDVVDAVHDCTPNHLHQAVNTDVLEAGKHLLAEKPLGMDSSETASLVEVAHAADVVSGVCFNYRHFPLVRQAKAMLAAGDMGRPHLIHGTYLQDWLLYPTDWNWRLDTAKGGSSRAIADIGSHWMDLIEYVTGQRIEQVLAVLDTIHEERRRPRQEVETFARTDPSALEPVSMRTEDAATVIFRTNEGVRGTFTVSQVSAGRKNHLFFEIDGADASISWDQEDPNWLAIGRRDEPNDLLPRDPALLGRDAAPLAHYPPGHQEGWPDALTNLFVDFYAAVAAHRAGASYEPSFASFEQAHHITLAVEAVLASDTDGGWQGVGTEGQTEGVHS